MSGIYFIINLYNGKYYVGSTTNFKRRWKDHRYYLGNNNHHCILLQRAWNKYGSEAFQFTIVEIVDDTFKLLEIEQLWINASNCCNTNIGYNLNPTAGSQLGFKWKQGHTDEWKKALSERSKGNQYNKGRKFTIEHREKLAASKIGKLRPIEVRIKIANGKIGKKQTKEHIENMRKARFPHLYI